MSAASHNQLTQLQAHLDKVQRIASLGTWELDISTGQLAWSKEIYRIFELDPAVFEPSYETFLELIHPDDRSKVDTAYKQSLEQRQAYDIIHRLRMADGRVKYVHEQCESVFADDGKPLQSFGVVQDVTEQYLTRQALSLLATRLAPLSGNDFYQGVSRYLCEALELDIAFVGQLNEEGTEVNACAGWMDGQALAPFSYELTGTPCANVMERAHAIHPHDIQVQFPSDTLLVEMGIESYIGSALFDKQQRPIGILVALGRRPLHQYQLAGQLLNLFVDSVSSEMVNNQANARMHFQYVFQRIIAEASTSLTMNSDEATFDGAVNSLLRHLGELFSVDRCYLFSLSSDLARFSNTHEWCAAGVEPQMQNIQNFPTAKMPWYRERMWEVIHVPDVAALPPEATVEQEEFSRQGIQSLLLVPMISAHGSLLGFIGFDAVQRHHCWPEEQIVMLRILADVLAGAIARRRMEQALAHSNAELEQFAYVVSHDLRQPLRMVNSYVGLLERHLADKLDEDTREMMHFASDGAKRMDQMLVSLLEYSRVGRMGEPMAPLDSRQVLDEALHFLQPAIKESAAEIVITGQWPQVVASRDEFSRLWQNLIDNALKYREPGRPVRIEISAEHGGEGWCFCVHDNGIGIEPDQTKRLFKVFQRLHTRREYEGTGVGLAVARKVVERHGGQIWVESPGKGQGSRFCFTLPEGAASTASPPEDR